MLAGISLLAEFSGRTDGRRRIWARFSPGRLRSHPTGANPPAAGEARCRWRHSSTSTRSTIPGALAPPPVPRQRAK
ncbi:MAG TPA: hypothetical protein VGS58_11900, partial [Candidatus Sulfopaludibacter sp.]|nr:hypothetical protein [Candidatus Sulfopaludibacter sp.]